jgi:16S rRNA (guanine966-N2)-methyltransferase
MLLHLAPQKFNTFNTFNIFDPVAYGQRAERPSTARRRIDGRATGSAEAELWPTRPTHLPTHRLYDLPTLTAHTSPMRVIAGERRGFQLKGPAGKFTRPMADRVREALFSMLASLGVEPARVLDLYAGTGGIGIEALSRGAEAADFVERNAAAAAVVRANLAHTRYTDVTRVYQEPVSSFLARAERNQTEIAPYDLIVMDPPYADPELVATLERVGCSPLVQSSATLVIGHSPRVTLPQQAGRLQRLRQRCYGDSCFSIYLHELEVGSAAELGVGAA